MTTTDQPGPHGDQLDDRAGVEAAVDVAVAAATAAFVDYRATRPAVRAGLLRAIADRLEVNRAELVERAHAETALPEPRLTGEVGRTCGQLRLLAGEVELGEHQQVRIDHAVAEGSPDLRCRAVPLGPVAVFGASNFPFAFSTAGGDTAAALAAGCPVVVKAHPAHPGTAEIAGRAISDAVAACGLPAGVFAQLFGSGNELGERLVAHPGIRAVGFTGSRAGGLALLRIAQARPVPIPVYAEMSSTNPVIVLPDRAGEVDDVAGGYVASLTLGAGQFCTNPGLLFVPRGADALVAAITERISQSSGATMLGSQFAEAYRAGVERLPATGTTATGRQGDAANAPAPVVTTCTAAELRDHPEWAGEVFGPAGVVVRYDDQDDLLATVSGLEGQLTVTVQAAAGGDHQAVRTLLPNLEMLAGRVIMNGWPTGVAVTHAMVHGGPYPATSDGRSTSVGTMAVERFQRPVAYQDFPEELLPPAVQEANPWALPRRVDGQLHR